MTVYEGKVVAEGGIKVGVIVSRFNEFITSKLIGGAIDGLRGLTALCHRLHQQPGCQNADHSIQNLF